MDDTERRADHPDRDARPVRADWDARPDRTERDAHPDGADGDVRPDEAGRGDHLERLAGWWQPRTGELLGLVALLTGAAVLTALVLVGGGVRDGGATARAGLEHDDMGAHGQRGSSDGHEHDAGVGDPMLGADAIGARVGPDGATDGAAPGVDPPPAGVDAAWSDAAPGAGTVGDLVRSADERGGGSADGEPESQFDAPPDLVVHVSGAVADPGLVTIPATSRVGDAVQAAGGVTGGALLERMNLARPVVDGEHLRVPHEDDDVALLPPLGGWPEPTGGVSPTAPGPPSGGAAAAEAGGGGGTEGIDPEGRVRINHADPGTLETLPGIGPARAETIVAHRTEHGAFTVPGDLRAVSGIGEVTFQRLAPLITVD